MAKQNFTVVEGQVFASANAVQLDELRKIKGFKSPFNRFACPFTNGQECGEFQGFVRLDWSNDTNDNGCYLGIKLSKIKTAVALSTFLKDSEDAIDKDGNYIHVENPDEGLAKIFRTYTDLTAELLEDIEKFFKESEEKRTFAVTKFITLTPWGKRQSRHLINIK